VNKRIGAVPWELADPGPQAVKAPEIRRIDAIRNARRRAWSMRI
jgi:hypothetical protein